MEIPIQVAVRIYSEALRSEDETNANAITKSTKTQEENETQKTVDANGNEDATEQQTKVLDNKNDELKSDTRFCVQAIPIAATTTAGGLLGLQLAPPPLLPSALPGGQLDSIAAGLIQVGPHSFPVTHALASDCTQSQVYHQTVFPLISLFMEGFDASVVTYGQRGSGKTYTLFGHGVDCAYGESDQGVIQRCVREIFAHIESQPERTYAVNVGFVEICGETIRDLLGVGNIHCTTIAKVFHCLQMGLAAKASTTSPVAATHTLFTLTLEQQWVSKEGLIQHRLSTASFSDLCATERQCILNAQDQPVSVPSDAGLLMLEQVVSTLTDPSLMYNVNGNIPYAQTTLTTLLKDSFGGRAQTLLILCVSPLEQDINETICNLQFAFKVQCVRNYVIMNTFSDDNTPISPVEALQVELPAGIGVGGGGRNTADNFGLQFAAGQWFKLVANAEGLFAKLISSNTLNDLEKAQIEEWLFLKQECEECLSSSEVLQTQKQLSAIQETEEPEELVSEPETSCQQNSDNETDTESQRPEFAEQLESLMNEFRSKTDKLAQTHHKDFLAKQPKAVMASQDSFKQSVERRASPTPLASANKTEKLDERKTSMGGRRRSIQPGASLSSAEIAMLNRVASREQQQQQQQQQSADVTAVKLHANEYLDSSAGANTAANAPVDAVQKKIRKLDADIEARQRQIKEIEQTMQLKQNIITELVKNSDTRTNAKQRFNKKKAKLEAEYEKAKKHMTKALVQGKDQTEVARLSALIAHIEQRLEDLTSIKHIAGESGQKVKKLQQSVHESKKQLEELQKKVKKERKLREQLETELNALKEARDQGKALVKVTLGARGYQEETTAAEGRQLKEVQARISHLEHILREKSENLEQDDGNAESLRHEIRNLRRTRDHLLEQRCSLDRKLKRDKMLTQHEERKLLECDEAIEAIDAAIEFKNELICGHKSIDTSERLQREKGEQMLMARLNKLSPEEMRTLLYKYFTKVIDLRDSSRKLEVQLVQLEREREAWEWKERVLSNAVRQARLEGERNAVLLQRQHEMKLTLMLRHMAEETSASSVASFGEREQRSLALTHHQRHGQGHSTVAAATNSTSTSTPATTDFDYELDFYKAHKMLKPAHLQQQKATSNALDMYPMHNAGDVLAKYKPSLEKYKDKERSGGSKNIFTKFQMLTRYASAAAAAAQSTTTTTTTSNPDDSVMAESSAYAAGATATTTASKKSSAKHKDETAVAIPQENLKRLMAPPPATKVTRQKNKIIIQTDTRKH